MNNISPENFNRDNEPTKHIKFKKIEDLVFGAISAPVKKDVENSIYDYSEDRSLIPEADDFGGIRHGYGPDISGGTDAAIQFESELLAEKLEALREQENNDLRFLDEPLPQFDDENFKLSPLMLPEHDEIEIEAPPSKAMDDVEGLNENESGNKKNGTEQNA